MYQKLFITQYNQNNGMGKWSWKLHLGMQYDNLSAVNIEADSSWITTLLLFLQLLMKYPEFAAEHRKELRNTKVLFLTT